MKILSFLTAHPSRGFTAEVLADELDAEVRLTALAGRDVIFLARRGPETLDATSGYPGDRSPLLAPLGAVFMAWADDAEVTAWLERASLGAEHAEFYRGVLAEIRARGFSVPMQADGRARRSPMPSAACATNPPPTTPSNTSPTSCRRPTRCSS